MSSEANPNDQILAVEHLSKTFRSHWTFSPVEALRDVSFAVNRGETFGYLGHNGAGKTTTIKCILGLVKVSSGLVRVNGRELLSAADRQAIGYLAEIPYFYDHLTVEETLYFFGRLYGLPGPDLKTRVSEIVERLGLGEKRHAKVRTLSKGLQQRLGFAQAIIGRPALLFLDEPFSGLDPLARVEFRNLILELKKDGATILLSSHILSDVDYLCDRVAIMTRGQMRSCFSLSDKAKLFGEKFELVIKDGISTAVENSLRESAERGAESTRPGVLEFTYPTEESAGAALRSALQAGCEVREFRAITPRLEDIFVAITAGQSGGSQ